ncbi:hypothetical protein EC973_007261 [Apophysomyces ossiformis]|uniref:DUF1308 domain-containing protein n=1 Tax=Apophysomyces ossiformis TaxID=679940 RepID=A0A8H7BY17_9FUNG|nr:hypothetical protein EC973_007261 [Apophysomyces ossiformis]
MSDDNEGAEAELLLAVKELYDRCQTILSACRRQDPPIEGLYRFQQCLKAEISFLHSLLENPSQIKKEYVQSTNLSYLEAIFEAMECAKPIEEIMRLVPVPPSSGVWKPLATMMQEHHIKLDLIAERGLVWIKVFARNAKALRHDMAGLEMEETESSEEEEQEEEQAASADGFEQLPILKKAREYLRAAHAHQVHFRTPVVVFAFMRIRRNEDEFVQRIMDKLQEMGVIVHLQDSDLRSSYTHLIDSNDLTTRRLNLDVSTVLALISEMSHHVCLPEQVTGEPLKVQAAREAEVPVLPSLRKILHNKQLCIVQSAYDRLESIVNIVGGSNEKARFAYLFRQQQPMAFDQALWTTMPSMEIQIIPDATSERFRKLLEPPSTQRAKLNNGRKIRSRFSPFHAIIFGSGDHYQMTTVTAIQWMQTALTDAGVTGVAIVCHEPRSLAEQKMQT